VKTFQNVHIKRRGTTEEQKQTHGTMYERDKAGNENSATNEGGTKNRMKPGRAKSFE
jgi:hypothetical protein